LVTASWMTSAVPTLFVSSLCHVCLDLLSFLEQWKEKESSPHLDQPPHHWWSHLQQHLHCLKILLVESVSGMGEHYNSKKMHTNRVGSFLSLSIQCVPSMWTTWVFIGGISPSKCKYYSKPIQRSYSQNILGRTSNFLITAASGLQLRWAPLSRWPSSPQTPSSHPSKTFFLRRAAEVPCWRILLTSSVRWP
jgi:hypothetical protein